MDSKNLHIKDYKRFFIQKGSTAAKDTQSEWGMIAKSNPYPLLPNPKSPYSNDWKDENGADEYVTNIYFEAMDIEVDFYACAASAATLRTWIDSFFSTVKSGYFSIYDEYTALGFQNVRYAGYEQESYSANGDEARAVFKVKFKVNDPATRMTMSNGYIVVSE